MACWYRSISPTPISSRLARSLPISSRTCSSGNYFAGIAVALVVGGVLGWLMNAAIFAPLRERGSELLPLIATIGVSIMLQNAMLVLLGPDSLRFRHALQQQRNPFRRHLFHGAEPADHRGVHYHHRAALRVYEIHLLGKALRAVSQDRETAGLMGINPNHLIMLTFIIASALAGMSGAMLGPVLVLTPFAGTSVIVKAFAIVIIGGFGNVEGTIIAGLIVGLIESYTTQFLDPGLIDIVVFALLLIMLAVRPTGLIAEKRDENV